MSPSFAFGRFVTYLLLLLNNIQLLEKLCLLGALYNYWI